MAEESLLFGIVTPNVERFGNPRDAAEVGRLAEESGWDGYFIWDVLSIIWESSRPTYDPWVALSSVAMATERIGSARVSQCCLATSRRSCWR